MELKSDRTGRCIRHEQRGDAVHRDKAVERLVLARPAVIGNLILHAHLTGSRLVHFRAIHFGHLELRDCSRMRGDLHEQAEAHAQYGKGAQDGHQASIPVAANAIKLAYLLPAFCSSCSHDRFLNTHQTKACLSPHGVTCSSRQSSSNSKLSPSSACKPSAS